MVIARICSLYVLALPRPNRPHSVDTYASSYGVGCTMFQTHEDRIHKPISCWYRSLNDAERNYDPTKGECLAVVWALQTLLPYLQNKTFTVFTDQYALNWLFKITEPSGRQTGWRLHLTEFDLELKYKKGAENYHADALSRFLTRSPTVGHDDDGISAFQLIDENDLDILSSTITSDQSIPNDAGKDEYFL